MEDKRKRSYQITPEGAALIEKIRKERGWNKNKLYEYLQTKTEIDSIPRILRNKKGEANTIDLIAEALDILPTDLVDEKEWLGLNEVPEMKSSIIDWRSVSERMLEDLKKLTTEALTAGDGIRFEFDNIFVPLGVVERQEKSKRKQEDGAPDRGSELYAEKVTPISHDVFFEDVLLRGNTKISQGKRIAIIGEAGAGKTTQLQKIGSWLLEETDYIPVWISLTALGAKSIREYLLEDWVRDASEEMAAPQAWKDSLGEAIKSGKVWLLLDGVDEMAVSKMTVSNPLSHLSTQLREGWLKDVRIVITCRVNVWDAGKNALTDFDVYRNLDFDYPNDVYQFIGNWFVSAPELAEKLKQALEQSGKERIRDMVKNPLRLTLLCFSWQKLQGELPETKAGLYDWFVKTFYEWKQDEVEKVTGIKLDRSKKIELNRALGELAKEAIDSEDSRFRLSETFINSVMRPDLFDLALKLNWLNEVGVAAENPLEKVYAFYHPSFQEYFAALAINDWDFFLPKFVQNRSNATTRYRVFESQWKEVILFWVGRGKITESHKEEFIKKLIEFDDHCGEFYRFRTYLLSAETITEFKNCSVADSIVEQVMIWGFGSFDRIEKERVLPSDLIQKSTLGVLPLTDCKRVTATLCQIIGSEKAPNDVRDLAIEYLGFVALVGEEREQAINTLINVIEAKIKEFNLCRRPCTLFSKNNPHSSIEDREAYEEIETSIEHTLTHSAWSLGIIAIGKESAIHTLIKLIDTFAENISTYANVLNQTAWSLGQITFGQAKELSIPALIRLMEYSESDFPYCQASSSLRLIASREGNNLLIQELICLMEKSDNEIVRQEASSFLRLLVLDEEWDAISKNDDLAASRQFHKEEPEIEESTIPNALLSLKDPSSKSYRESSRTILSLMSKFNKKDFHSIVSSLRDSYDPYEDDNRLVSRIFRAGSKTKNRGLLHKDLRKPKSGARINKDTNDNRNNCIFQVLWECSKIMSYPDFLNALHDKQKSIHPEVEDNAPSRNKETINQLNNLIFDSHKVQVEIDNYINSSKKICLFIDCRDLEQEKNSNLIIQKIGVKIFESLDLDFEIPEIQQVSNLKSELTNLQRKPDVKKIAIALYSNSANEAIEQLCQSLAPIQTRLFTGGQTTQELITKINAWLSEM